jgi:ABC-type nitrate/sulfonate/bicarbonate transport system substrate-binding protein
MEQDRFDFVWVFEGWDALRAREVEQVELNSIVFADYLDCIPDWYTPVLITNGSLLEEEPELVRTFLEVTTRGYELAASDPQAAAGYLLEAAPELDEALVRASADYHAPKYAALGRWGEQDGEVWDRFAAFLLEAGLIEEEVDASEAFTNEFLPDGS